MPAAVGTELESALSVHIFLLEAINSWVQHL